MLQIKNELKKQLEENIITHQEILKMSKDINDVIQIIVKRLNRMLVENKSKKDCFEELTYMFPNSDQKILIEEILDDR